MPTQKIDPKVIFASDAPVIDKPPVFSDKTKGWDVARANDGRPEIKQMNKMQQDTDLKILWLNENAVLPYDLTIDYPDGAVTIKDGLFKQLSSGSWVEFLDDFADKDAVKRGIANRYDPLLTYNSGERVVLANGDIVKSTIDGNVNDPNVNITGWVKTNSASQIFDESGQNQQQVNNGLMTIADMLLITSPQNGTRSIVTGLQGGTFIYDSTKSGVNDGIVTFNGHVRQVTGLVTPFMAGAQAQVGIDDSDAINIALSYARTNGLKCWGVGKTFECHDLLIDDDLMFVDAKLVCNKFDTDLISVMSTTISATPLKNVYLSKIKINGKRELHTAIKGQTIAEDGGRHAFRFRRPIDGLYMEECAGNNSAGDGIEFFPDGAGNGLLKNIKIVDCEFNWNRRHGGSGDKAAGIEFIRTKFLYNNLDLPSASGSPNNSLGIFADRNSNNTHQYGAGFDLEEYGTSDVSKSVRFIDCAMYGNAYASLTLYRPTGWSNFTGDNDIVIAGGTYGAGLNGLISIEVSPFAPFGGGFNKAFKGVKIDNINCMGGAIYTRYSDVSVSRLSNVSEIRVHGQGVLRSDREYLFNNSLSTIYVGSMLAETATMDAALLPYRYTLRASIFKIPEVSGKQTKLQIQGSSVRAEHLVAGDSLRGWLGMTMNATWGGTDFTMWNQQENRGLYFNLHDMFIAPSTTGGASLGLADLRFSTAYLQTAPNVASDKRYKKEVKSLTRSEKAVAADLKKNIKTYLLIGSDDQIHIGMIAQEVVEIFERHGLDAHKYKMIHVDDDGMYSIVYEQLCMFICSS